MSRIDVAIHSDESGSFQASSPTPESPYRREPFVLASIVHLGGRFDPADAADLWESIDLGPFGRFHASASDSAERSKLDSAAREVVRRLAKTPDAALHVVSHNYRRGSELPREDMYLDLVFHLVVGAVRRMVATRVQDASWQGLVPLKVEVDLARRDGLNLRPMESSLTRAIARDLERVGLGRNLKRKGDFVRRGVHTGAIRVHCSVAQAQHSPYLTLSDLLCNFFFRGLGRHDQEAKHLARAVRAEDLAELLQEDDWRSITADAPLPVAAAPGPPPAPPTRLAARLDGLLSEPGTEWTMGVLRTAGVFPQGRALEDRLEVWRGLLEEAENACEERRDFGTASRLWSLVGEFEADKDWRKGLDDETRDRLWLERASVGLAVANHAGMQLPNWLDLDEARQRSARLVGHPTHQDTVAHFHNRLAVNALNRFSFAEAEQDARSLVELLRTERGGFAAFLGAQTAPSWHFGALLGTLGQALALRGFVQGDQAAVQEATDYFMEAGRQFDAGADQLRQCSYLAHGHLDLLRMGGAEDEEARWETLLEMFGSELEEDVAGFLADPAGSDSWRQAFAVHVELKRAWLLEDTPSWAGDLHGKLSAQGVQVLAHPRQQIYGLLARMISSPTGGPLVASLRRTAEAGDTLVHLLARLHHADLVAGSSGSALEAVAAFAAGIPDWLRPGWEAAGMPKALQACAEDGVPLVDALPFYYL